jgi:peptidoglycan hydrolase-like protein with peptidoglycan-binding domain
VRRFSLRRTPGRWVVLALAATALAAGVHVVERSSSGSPPRATVSAATSTAVVARRNLVDRESLDGTLGYRGSTTILGHVPGTLTWLPGQGRVVARGGALYRVDGKRVVLFYGRVPAWRTLAAGSSDGRDVYELERNLVALGYDSDGTITVDDHFDWATALAVKRWQKDFGLDQTGRVDLGRVVFGRGAQRIAEVQGSLGGQALGPLLKLSSTARVVTVKVDAAEQTLVHIGDRVLVDLPTGEEARGAITSVGRVAQRSESSNSGAVIEVEIGFGKRARLPELDQAPVTVRIARQRKRNALSVPVTALLAQPGGGFAVETVHGTRHAFVAVQLGLFADGYVEISGRGLEPGTKVVVAQ